MPETGEKLRVLIMTVSALNKNNSVGSTFSNFFEGMENVELASLYCGYGEPYNDLDMKYFQITEKSLIKNLINKNYPSGREVTPGNTEAVSMNSKEAKGFDFFRTVRWQILFWARELIWVFGRKNTKELKAFLDDFSPEVILFALNDTCYLGRECRRIAKERKLPICIFFGDDMYSLKRISFSPLFWIDRFIKRAVHRKIIRRSSKLFVMTEMAKKEYDRTFHADCALLTKSLDFIGEPSIPERADNAPLRFVYTGNLYAGRWKSVASLGEALQRLNDEGTCGRQAELVIYSKTIMSKRMKEALNIPAVDFMGGVPSSEIPAIQQNADVLVHAESMQKKNMLVVRLSFSTKLVDYMHVPRCILAIGPSEQSSVDHLIRNDAAVTVTSDAEMYDKVKALVSDPALIDEYAAKAWRCGAEHHNRQDVQQRLYGELLKAARGADK